MDFMILKLFHCINTFSSSSACAALTSKSDSNLQRVGQQYGYTVEEVACSSSMNLLEQEGTLTLVTSYAGRQVLLISMYFKK